MRLMRGLKKLEQLIGRGAAAVQLPEIKSEAVHHDKNPDAPPWNAQSENKDIDSSQKRKNPNLLLRLKLIIWPGICGLRRWKR